MKVMPLVHRSGVVAFAIGTVVASAAWGGTPEPLVKLVVPDGAADDRLGCAVGIGGERAVIGAWRADDSGPESGSASVVTFGSGPAGDLDGDGAVNGSDLGILLAAWGTPGPGDLSGDGTVDGADLGTLLAAWTGGSRRAVSRRGKRPRRDLNPKPSASEADALSN